jgi:hypothetical protein
MTTIDAEPAGASPPMFSPEDPVETLWIKSYQGEVLGEILFGRMAEQIDDPDHARKLRVLSTLERKTKEAMVASLERAGIPTEPDAETVQAAESLADGMAAVSWSDLVGSLEPVTTQYAAMYARIGELDPSEQATADLLVAHELALRSFGRLEIAGQGAESLVAITALPHLA